MAYDEGLADRIRALLDGRDPIEKQMFGGIGFMVGGKMAIAASGRGGIMVRVDPDESDALCEGEGVERMIMRGRPLDGWLRVQAAQVDSDSDLRAWIERGVRAADAAGAA
ncbi:MAG: TfoX/Sxy family protein [Solirubrobacterales bacterium]|nr:TfoX/Sxy family protein [Solirubrobacterales bacterium]